MYLAVAEIASLDRRKDTDV